MRLVGEPPEEADKTKVSVLPQEFSPPERLTPEELIEYYGSLYPEEVTREADALADEMGLSSSRGTRYADLSGGQKKLLDLGRVLMLEPDLILLDEPVAGVNPVLADKLAGFIEELNEEGITFLIIEHDMRVIADICDRVTVFDQGDVIVEEEDNVRERGKMAKAKIPLPGR